MIPPLAPGMRPLFGCGVCCTHSISPLESSGPPPSTVAQWACVRVFMENGHFSRPAGSRPPSGAPIRPFGYLFYACMMGLHMCGSFLLCVPLLARAIYCAQTHFIIRDKCVQCAARNEGCWPSIGWNKNWLCAACENIQLPQMSELVENAYYSGIFEHGATAARLYLNISVTKMCTLTWRAGDAPP